jgi:hypothetical protein
MAACYVDAMEQLGNSVSRDRQGPKSKFARQLRAEGRFKSQVLPRHGHAGIREEDPSQTDPAVRDLEASRRAGISHAVEEVAQEMPAELNLGENWLPTDGSTHTSPAVRGAFTNPIQNRSERCSALRRRNLRTPGFVPIFARIDHLDYKKHHRDLDQYTDHGGQCRAGIEAEQANGSGYREFEKVRCANQCRGTSYAVGFTSAPVQPVGERRIE